MDDHVCACSVCDPSLAPSGPRQGEHHVGVRFAETRDWRCEPFLDGEPLKFCYEMLAGENGTAWVYQGEARHFCDKCRIVHDGEVIQIGGPCAKVIHGNLSFRRIGARQAT